MTIVTLICPTCKHKGKIDVSESAMKDVTRGLLAINIAPKIICEHSFIAYVDKNFNIRDYFIADFQIELPEITPKQNILSDPIPAKDIVDIDLIKLNISGILLTYILKSIFTKQKIVLISDQEYLFTHILNFFKYILQDAYIINLTLLKRDDYENNKNQYNDYIVFDGNGTILNNEKLINPKKLSVEKQIVNRFLTETELGFSYIILKNEIYKSYELAKSIVDFFEEEKKKGNKTNIIKINNNLEDSYNVKINPLYLKFLIGIVESYFGIAIPSISGSFVGAL